MATFVYSTFEEYTVNDKSLTWNDAKAECQSQGGQLAQVTDDEIHKLVKKVVRGRDNIAITLCYGFIIYYLFNNASL